MVIFVMFKWYKLLHYKEIPPIYWMTLVCVSIIHVKYVHTCVYMPVEVKYFVVCLFFVGVVFQKKALIIGSVKQNYLSVKLRLFYYPSVKHVF